MTAFPDPDEFAFVPALEACFEEILLELHALGRDAFVDAPDALSLPGKDYLPFCVADLGTVAAGDVDRLESVDKDLSWAKVEPFAPVRCAALGPRSRGRPAPAVHRSVE